MLKKEELQQMVDSGMTAQEIAEEKGMNRGHIARRIDDLKTSTSDARRARAQMRELAAENKRMQAELDRRQILADAVKIAVERVVPAAPPAKGLPAKNKKLATVDAVVVISDWHVGLTVKQDELEGFGSYDFKIADRRVRALSKKVLDLVDTLRTGYNVDNLHIISLGDMVDGNIHHEQYYSMEFPVPVQIAKAGYLLAQFVRDLEPHFARVDIHCNDCDNHSRMFKKPIAASKAQWSYGYLVHTVATAAADTLDEVYFHRTENMKMMVKVQDTKFLCEHGDGIKAYMGIPWYGIERQSGREAKRRMGNPDIAYDYHVMGHWHVAGMHGRNIFNGSLCGTTAYDHACGRWSKPEQIMFLVGKHGPFNFTAFDLDKS